MLCQACDNERTTHPVVIPCGEHRLPLRVCSECLTMLHTAEAAPTLEGDCDSPGCDRFASRIRGAWVLCATHAAEHDRNDALGVF